MRRRHTTILAVILGGYGLWKGSTLALIAGFLILLWANWRTGVKGALGEVSGDREPEQYKPVGSFRTDSLGVPSIAVAPWPGAYKCC